MYDIKFNIILTSSMDWAVTVILHPYIINSVKSVNITIWFRIRNVTETLLYLRL